MLVERDDRVLSREAAPVGEALGEALRADGIEVLCGVAPASVRREGQDYVLELEDGRLVKGERLLVCAGRHPRFEGLGLETMESSPTPAGFPSRGTCA